MNKKLTSSALALIAVAARQSTADRLALLQPKAIAAA
jgi:hypothetical protein